MDTEKIVAINGKYRYKLLADGSACITDCLSDETVLRIPGDIHCIGEFAFSECSNLKQVILSEGVEEIEHGAFEHCRNLTDLYIPSTVCHIGDWAFDDCPKLKLWVHEACFGRLWGYFREFPELDYCLVKEPPFFHPPLD